MPDLIERLSKLLEQATPGPWAIDGVSTPEGDLRIGTPDWEVALAIADCGDVRDGDQSQTEANAYLLAEAINALPLLLRAARALKELAEYRHSCGSDRCGCHSAADEADLILQELATAGAGVHPEGAK